MLAWARGAPARRVAERADVAPGAWGGRRVRGERAWREQTRRFWTRTSQGLCCAFLVTLPVGLGDPEGQNRTEGLAAPLQSALPSHRELVCACPPCPCVHKYKSVPFTCCQGTRHGWGRGETAASRRSVLRETAEARRGGGQGRGGRECPWEGRRWEEGERDSRPVPTA